MSKASDVQEFVFTIDYEAGFDHIMDAFIDHPKAVADSLSIAVSPNGMWRVDKLSGPESFFEALREPLLDPHYCNDCLCEPASCETVWNHEVILSGLTERTVYSYMDELGFCRSIPYLALDELGDGLLFEAQRREHRYEWRLLVPDDREISPFFDRVKSELGDGRTIQFEQLKEPLRWGEAAVSVADLPAEQRVALEAALKRGYYQTPRETTVRELATELDVSRSTLQYRLRRAEYWLVSNLLETSL
ncbi:helix-turn-helix domain-containing protein [Halorussus halophilus]|uniref:helix-turn-helix domain-containing protein n=1 Tax=Halorussus halophilus TaxID=2650975 RepID=UPI0017877D98|nr:helix-turn-helix domain-containing protein [Halorussus halophilus]